MTHGLRNSLCLLEGVSFIKKLSGVISERRLYIFAGMCVPEIQFNERKDNLNMSHTNTYTQNITLLPLICHLCAFQQKTFLQDRTGH